MLSEDIKSVVSIVKGHRMTAQNLERATTVLKKNPELYKKVARLANRRLKALRKKRVVSRSFAYQNLKVEYGLSAKHPYVTGSTQNRDKIKSVLRFIASDTSTYTGLMKVEQSKKQNVINQIIKNSDLSKEDLQTLKEYLEGLSEKEFRNLIDAYSSVLDDQFITGSGEQFNFIGNHIISKAQQYKATKKDTMVGQIKNELTQYKANADPVDQLAKSATEVGQDFGISMKSTLFKGKKSGATISKEDLQKALGK